MLVEPVYLTQHVSDRLWSFFFFLASKLARISKETPFQAEVTLGQLSSSIPFTLPEMRMNGYLWFVSSEPLEFRSVLDL